MFSFLGASFLDLIYSQKCLICGCSKSVNFLCKNCLKNVNYLSGFAHRISDGILFYSCSNYDGIVKKLIHKLKFQHSKNASIPLAIILFNYFKKLNLDSGNFIIAYPNTYYFKKLSKGYNHTFLIAKEFSKLAEIELVSDLILKTKYTYPQYKAKDKRKNILNSFKINKNKLNKIKGKTVLLIDDIITTGATLDEIIKCFKKENINDVVCLTVAKSVK